jgi:hypothetical protein
MNNVGGTARPGRPAPTFVRPLPTRLEERQSTSATGIVWFASTLEEIGLKGQIPADLSLWRLYNRRRRAKVEWMQQANLPENPDACKM